MTALPPLGPANVPPPQPTWPNLTPHFPSAFSCFLLQMHMAITLGAIGAALLAFAAGSKKSKSPMHAVGVGVCVCGLSGRGLPAGHQLRQGGLGGAWAAAAFFLAVHHLNHLT